MRTRLIAFTIFTALALVVASSYRSGPAAMNGGTLLTTHQERTGIFEIATYDGTTAKYRCTATVLYSSVATNRSWLVTAANCFSERKPGNLFPEISGHFSPPRASVRYDVDADTSGTSEYWTSPASSVVYQNPEWTANGGITAWFGTRDIAFIRVNMAIPIYDTEGLRILEFRRPIYTGPATSVSEPDVNPAMKNFSRNAFCGQGDGQLRCDTLSNLWYSPNFRNQFFQLPAGAWDNGFYAGGDAGGPLLKYAPGLNRQWDGAGGILDVAMYGAVLGVLQGPTVACEPWNNSHCNPSDGLAGRFANDIAGATDFDDWLNTITDAYEDIPRITAWTITNHFVAGVGQSQATDQNLISGGRNNYTFPAYAGEIVGVGINKSNGRVHIWYDNGFMTIGTRYDLDDYSQVDPPLLPDLMPTTPYSGAPGKLYSQIVAMMINRNGQTSTWYDDGTAVMGSVTNLDSINGPFSYQLPAGKTPRDIVAIASRTGGGVLAYYRDGTVSEGDYYNLSQYAPPRPFQTGNGRDPKEILGIDTYASGATLTLFEQRRNY